MINIKRKAGLNLYWISTRLVVLSILSFLIIGCQPVSAREIQATTTPTTIQHLLVTPTQQNVQVPTVTATQQAVQVPMVTPAQQTGQPTQATPTIGTNPVVTQLTTGARIKTVFIIMMENHNWSDILNNPSAPYINQTLLPQASYALQYFNPTGNHPSEPNYLWLEAGTSLGITNDGTTQNNHQSTTDHLVTYLDKAGVTWKAYQEGISGKVCPLKGTGLYAPKHNPMVFFDNVTSKKNIFQTKCLDLLSEF
jgi:phospholipase C